MWAVVFPSVTSPEEQGSASQVFTTSTMSNLWESAGVTGIAPRDSEPQSGGHATAWSRYPNPDWLMKISGKSALPPTTVSSSVPESMPLPGLLLRESTIDPSNEVTTWLKASSTVTWTAGGGGL